MDKVPMTVADVYPAASPGRTRSATRSARTGLTRSKGGSRQALGDERQFLSRVLSLDGDLLCELRRSPRGVTTSGASPPAGAGQREAGGRGLPRESRPSLALQRSLLRALLFLLPFPAPDSPHRGCSPPPEEAGSQVPRGAGRRTAGGEEGGRQVKAYRLLLLDPRHAGWQLRRPARWNSEPGSREQRRWDARRAVATAAAAAGLPGRRYKKAPQTRRTSLDQPPPPTPPPATLLSAPSAPPAAPNPGDPAAAWAGSSRAPDSPERPGQPGWEAGPCSPPGGLASPGPS